VALDVVHAELHIKLVQWPARFILPVCSRGLAAIDLSSKVLVREGVSNIFVSADGG